MKAGPQLETSLPVFMKKYHPELVPELVVLLSDEEDSSSVSHISIGSVDTDTDFKVDDISKAL